MNNTNPVNCTIIYGPPGCKKTTHKEKFAEYFRTDFIIDNWSPDDQPVPKNTLLLTNINLAYFPKLYTQLVNNGNYLYCYELALYLIENQK